MSIRKYGDEDRKQVLGLQDEFEKEFFPESYNDPMRSSWEADLHDIHSYYCRNGGQFWVVEYGEKIIGMGGIVVIDDTNAELKRIRIQKKSRGRGYGRLLLFTAENYCKTIDIERIFLDCSERLVIARKMYENNGYKEYKMETLNLTEKSNQIVYYYEKLLI